MSRLSGMSAEETWDANNILDGDKVFNAVTVPGAALGDFAFASLAIDLTDLQLTADVTAANTVTCVLSNSTGGAINLASALLRVKVVPFDVI